MFIVGIKKYNAPNNFNIGGITAILWTTLNYIIGTFFRATKEPNTSKCMNRKLHLNYNFYVRKILIHDRQDIAFKIKIVRAGIYCTLVELSQLIILVEI